MDIKLATHWENEAEKKMLKKWYAATSTIGMRQFGMVLERLKAYEKVENSGELQEGKMEHGKSAVDGVMGAIQKLGSSEDMVRVFDELHKANGKEFRELVEKLSGGNATSVSTVQGVASGNSKLRVNLLSKVSHVVKSGDVAARAKEAVSQMKQIDAEEVASKAEEIGNSVVKKFQELIVV
jgi:hypothetical protein